MAHTQKPDFVFLRNGRVHLNRQGHQFSRLLAAKVCASAVVMLGTPCSEVLCRVLATHSICQFPLHFPSHASLCAINFNQTLHATGTSIKQCLCRFCTVYPNIQLPVVYILPTWNFLDMEQQKKPASHFNTCNRQKLTAYMHSLMSPLLTTKCTHFPLSKGTFIKFLSNSKQL